MIDYNDNIPNESLIPFVDFYRAFDTVSNEFMNRTIEFLGFGKFSKSGKNLIQWM